MHPTTTFLTDCFNRFNNIIFKGSLPTPRLTVNNNRSRLGQLTFRVDRRHGANNVCTDFTLSVSRVFDREQQVWEDTIIHEMIHLYIHTNGYADTSAHGEIFRAVMDKINHIHHRNITVTAHLSAAERDSDQARRIHYVCVIELTDGRMGLACVSRTRLFELWDTLPNGFNHTSSQWYLSHDPYFNRFRRVMTPKIYIVDDPTQLRAALSSSKRLLRSGTTIYTAR